MDVGHVLDVVPTNKHPILSNGHELLKKIYHILGNKDSLNKFLKAEITGHILWFQHNYVHQKITLNAFIIQEEWL